MSDLPPGFELDAAPAQIPALPAGFELDHPRTVSDKLTGATGERYQTWPERLLRGIGSSIASGVTLPGDIYQGKAQIPSSGGAVPGSVPFGDINSSGERVADLAFIASPINPAARAGDLALPGAQRAVSPQSSVPTVQQLKTAASEGYQSPAVKSLEIKPQAVADYSATTRAKLNQEGFDDTIAPKTFAVLGKFENAPDGAIVTGDNLNSMRKILGRLAGSQDREEAAAASRAIRDLDEKLTNLGQQDVLAGDAEGASQTLKTARDNYSAAMHAETIDKKTIQAELRAAASNSGQNVANTIRQRMADILLKPELQRGYAPSELAQMERIVRGTRTENALRIVGNALGGGGGLGAITTAAIGGYATGGPGAVAPIIGYAIKALGNRMTLKQAEALSEAVRARAPLAKSMEDFGSKASAFQQFRGPKTISAVVLSARNLSNNLKDAGISFSPADIMKAIQGPVKSAADQDQQN